MFLIVLLETSAIALHVLIIQAIREIGFPRNVQAIPWLVDQAISSEPLTMHEASETLKDIDPDAVVPFLTAILLNRESENREWAENVKSVCHLVTQKKQWMIECGPSIAYLLAQDDYEPNNRPDREALLSVLEPILFACTYALPAIYRLAFLEGESNIGKKARHMLRLFGENDLRPYRYLLENLLTT
jgi:hypothetical protein